MDSSKKFVFNGAANHAIRLDEELKNIDKIAADKAFKMQKKRLDAFMQANGFVKYKGTAYVRKNAIDVLEYVNLQKEAYGSKTFTVNYALIPLYVPHDFLSFDLGGRLAMLIIDRDIWWDFANEKAAEISFSNVMEAISEYLFPWFQYNSNKENLVKSLLEEKKRNERYGVRLTNKQQKWLDILMGDGYDAGVIEENMRVFKLPEKLNKN